MGTSVGYYCDDSRHLVCVPYGREELHEMARALGIGRHWFHASPNHTHYDIPKRRVAEIQAKCIRVSSREIIKICQGNYHDDHEDH